MFAKHLLVHNLLPKVPRLPRVKAVIFTQFCIKITFPFSLTVCAFFSPQSQA